MRARPGAAAALGWLVAALFLGAACNRRALLPRGEGAAVVVVDGAARSPAGPPDEAEREPNDKAAMAQDIVLGPSGFVVAGTLAIAAPGAKSGDADVFRIHLGGVRPDAGPLPLPVDAAAVASAPGGDGGTGVGPSVAPPPRIPERTLGFFLELLSASETAVRLDVLDGKAAVIQSVSARSGRLGVPNLAAYADDDTFLLRVSRGRATVRAAAGRVADAGRGEGSLGYRLVITPQSFSPGDEIEPNGDPAHATPILIDASRGEVAGWCGWRGDVDSFAVAGDLIPPGGALAVELDLPTGVAARVRVIDQSGSTWIDSGVARGRIRPLPARGPRVEADAGGGDVAVQPTLSKPLPTSRLWITIKTESGFSLDQRYVLRVQGVIPESPP